MPSQNAKTCCEQLGYTFQTEAYLNQAFTHRSAGDPHNERLEFLGDAVLGLVITDALFQRYPTEKEGKLSILKSALVKGKTLAAIATEYELGPHIKLGTGEIKTGGATRTSILANTLEALFGAIFLDGGFEAAQAIILKVYHTRLTENHLSNLQDAKTELQEYLHAQKIPLPQYNLVQTKGAQHAQEFHVRCTIATLDLSENGMGKTRKSAEQNAARALLKKLKNIK